MSTLVTLTEDEVEFLVECLDIWYFIRDKRTSEDLVKYINLRQYLMTGERR